MTITESPTAVYRAFGEEGELLYVGITVNPEARFRAHAKSSPWWSLLAYMEIVWVPDRRRALEVEDQAIIEELPEFNVAGHPDYVQRFLGDGASL